jgi:hypothetical protein
MTEYYVDDAVGSDSNDGLNPGTGNAWLTIGRGAFTEPIGAGDRLNIYPGNYTGIEQWPSNGIQHGAVDAHIIYEGIGSGVTIDAAPTSKYVWSVFSQYVDYKNLEFEWDNASFNVFEIDHGGGLTFEDCTFDGETLTGGKTIYCKDANVIGFTNNIIKGNKNESSSGYPSLQFDITSASAPKTNFDLIRNTITGKYVEFTAPNAGSFFANVRIDGNDVSDTRGSAFILRNVRQGWFHNNIIYLTSRGGGGYPLNFADPNSGDECSNIEIANNTCLSETNGQIYRDPAYHDYHTMHAFNNVIFCETMSTALTNIQTADYFYDVVTDGSNFRMGADQSSVEIDSFLGGFVNVTYSGGVLTVTDHHSTTTALWAGKGKTVWGGQSAPTHDFEEDNRY